MGKKKTDEGQEAAESREQLENTFVEKLEAVKDSFDASDKEVMKEARTNLQEAAAALNKLINF